MFQNLCTRVHVNADPRLKICSNSLAFVWHFVLTQGIKRKHDYGKKNALTKTL